jgi:hypothetical protein
MGYFLGQKMPEYNPFWEEPEYADQPDWWKWYHLGYEDGYGQYPIDTEPARKVAQENEALKALIAANYRTMREEIKKELDTNTS